MNKVVLIGNLVKDAELKFTPNSGKAVCSFTIAINEGWGDNKKTEYINIVAWNKTAEAIVNYTKKGDKIAVVGRIQTRSYDAQDGTKRYVTEVVASEVEFLSNGRTNKTQDVQNSFDDFEDDMTPVDEDSSDIPF